MSIQLVMPFNHLIFCHLLLLPSVFPSIRVFSNESALCIRWSKYWSFSTSASNEYSRLISFRIDWFDLLAVPWKILESSLAPQSESINSLAFTLLSLLPSCFFNTCEIMHRCSDTDSDYVNTRGLRHMAIHLCAGNLLSNLLWSLWRMQPVCRK